MTPHRSWPNVAFGIDEEILEAMPQLTLGFRLSALLWAHSVVKEIIALFDLSRPTLA